MKTLNRGAVLSGSSLFWIIVISLFPDDVLERMMDNRTAEDCKLLLGHTGPVYGASFSNDRNYLTSSSEDGTGIYH